MSVSNATLAERFICDSEMTEAEVYRCGAELVGSALGGAALMYIVREDSLDVVSHHGAPSELVDRIGSLSLESESLVAQAARARVMMDADGAAEGAAPDARASAELGSGRWTVAIPLVTDERLLGVLECFAAWPEGDRDLLKSLLSTLAGVISPAVARAGSTSMSPPWHMSGTVQNTTEKDATNRAVKKNELLFRKVLETLPVGVWISDERGELIMVNSAGMRIWGGARLVGIEQFGLFKARWADTGKPVANDEWALTRAIRNLETTINDCLEIQTFDGKEKIIFNSAAPVLDPQGRILGAFAINEDVTLRRRLEQERERLVEALSNEQRWLHSVFQRSPIGILLCQLSTSGEPQFMANRRAEELAGMNLPQEGVIELLAKRIRHVDGSEVSPDDLSVVRALRGEVINGREVIFRKPSERDAVMLVNASPIHNEHGHIIGAVVTYEDITSLKELERLRQEWTSIVAHDLRQPVATIATIAGLLERSTSDPKNHARAERLIQSVQRLDRMIGDLSDLSRIESHRIELLPVPTDIAALLGRVIEANDERDRIMLSIVNDIPIICVDPQRIEQIMENLISNALKYGTTTTPVEIIAEQNGNEVTISVRNQGQGITADDMPTLFERFQRGRSHRNVKGLGLGLYIVRGLVEAHGGRVEVDSVPDQTTTFRVALPISAAHPTPSSAS